jgi:choline-sulfatase
MSLHLSISAASLALLSVLLPPRVQVQPSPQAGPRPNLLLIIADDHAGGTLGIEGDPRQATPNLDKLARQGVLFARAYCNAPVCTPSRQSLITGKLPHAVGVTQLQTPLPDDAVTLGDWLKALGYDTCAIGKMHFNGPSRHGFSDRVDIPKWEQYLSAHPPAGGDHRRRWRPFLEPASEWLNASARSTGLPAESMQSSFFVDEAIRRFRKRGDRPFAMVVSFYDPHSPFHFPEEWRGRFPTCMFGVPALTETDKKEQPAVFAPLRPEEILGIQAAYFTSLSFVDHQVGRLIKALDDAGLSEKTLVVYVGDNGYMLGQHGRFEKHCFYEPAVRVPLIMRWPDHLPSGGRIESLMEMLDILPTVLHFLQVPAPPGLQGIDLAPLVMGSPAVRERDLVFSEYLENEEAMVSSGRFKLIIGTGRRLRQDGYQSRTPLPLPGPYERLYNLASDPEETTDVSRDPQYAAIKAELLEQMFDRIASTWVRPLPIPPGLSHLEAIHWCLVPRDR